MYCDGDGENNACRQRRDPSVGHECFNEDMRGNLESCVMILQGG